MRSGLGRFRYGVARTRAQLVLQSFEVFRARHLATVVVDHRESDAEVRRNTLQIELVGLDGCVRLSADVVGEIRRQPEFR